MVLLQVVLNGYSDSPTNTKISAKVPCGFYGRYKVKLLSYDFRWGVQPNQLLEVQSQALIGNMVNNLLSSQLIISSNTANATILNTNGLEFVCDQLAGVIDINLTMIDGVSTPSTFVYGILNFDFEKVDERMK